MATDTETDKGKETILSPSPKKSFLDRAPNRLARTIAQVRTGHWLSAAYLERVRKNRDENISDLCWWCGRFRMSRPMSFFNVPTRIWKMQGPQSGTAREKMVEKESGHNLWVNF
jgi:hypothetical protein